MRKIILIFLLLTFCFYSCDPKEHIDPKYRGTYNITNLAEVDIQIKGTHIALTSIKQGETKSLYFGDMYVMLGEKFSKDFFYDFFNNNYIQDSIIILSTKGDTLKIWREEEKDSPGKQYYHLDFWKKTQEEKNYHIYINWLFELLPEDIDTSKLTN